MREYRDLPAFQWRQQIISLLVEALGVLECSGDLPTCDYELQGKVARSIRNAVAMALTNFGTGDPESESLEDDVDLSGLASNATKQVLLLIKAIIMEANVAHTRAQGKIAQDQGSQEDQIWARAASPNTNAASPVGPPDKGGQPHAKMRPK